MSIREVHSSQPLPSDSGIAESRFEWDDGQGRRWTIVADSRAVSLRCGDQRIDIPKARFGSDLYVSPAGGQVVVRFSDAHLEAGFLVPESEAEALLKQLGYDPTTPDQHLEAERAAALVIRPDWPQMTTRCVWALICASLAFIPFVGIAFAAVATILILQQRARTRPAPATLHIRTMLTISGGLVIWGLGVWALSTWTWYQPFPVEELTSTGAGAKLPQVARVVLSLLVILFSLSVHEAAHAIAAWWCGDGYARSLGRVTLNPKAHIDPFGTVVLPVLLAVSGFGVFGYARPVPVQLAGIRRFRRAHILISIAGPGSNLLLAAISLSLLLAMGCVLRQLAPDVALRHFASLSPVLEPGGFSGASLLAVLACVLKMSVLINILLAAFNMIPVPPLDGSWVLEHLFPNTLGQIYVRIRPFGFIIFMLLFFNDLLDPLLTPGWYMIETANALVRDCVGF